MQQPEHAPFPFNADSEMCLLGNLLYWPELIGDIAPVLVAEDFYRDTHQTIYSIMVALYDEGHTPDAIIVSDTLTRKGITEIDDKSPFGYLTSLMNREPTSARLETHARLIAKLAEHRRLAKVALEMYRLAHSGEENAVEQAESLMLQVRRGGKSSAFVSIGDYYATYLNHLHDLETGESNVRGIPTGITDLDDVLGGLQRGALTILAARPRVGKTSLVQNFVYNAAKFHKKRTAFFSLEMPLNDLMDRFVAIDAAISSQKLRTGTLTPKDKDRLYGDTYALFEQLGIYLNYTPGITIADLKNQARWLVNKYSIDVIVVDFLQLVKALLNGKRVTPRELEVAEVTRELKNLAGELNIAVIAPTQINREIEKRAACKVEGENLTFKMPMLSDIRESGEIEQSADVVMFLTRSEEKQERVKLIVAKHRNGQEGELDLYFKGEEMRFHSLTAEGALR